MAMTHRDKDHHELEALQKVLAEMRESRDGAFALLQTEANEAEAAGTSRITTEGEPLRQWEAYGVHVRELPERETDEALNLCRVSLGGSPTEGITYCVFRGPVGQVKDVLRRALNALRDAP